MNILQRLRSIYHPAWYHGQRKGRGYFEGWYFKNVSAEMRHRFAIIPGVFKDDDPEIAHCFVQVLDGSNGHSTYHRYPIEQFRATDGAFEVWVGPNYFSLSHITLDIDDQQRQISGTLHYRDLKPWPVLPLSPGAMGPFAFIPIMEGFHGVLSFGHSIEGVLSVDGQHHDFTGGRGYIEKDWGRQFPLGYIWLQTNHFDSPDTCLTGAVAITKFGRIAFRGFIIGFWHDGVLYRFTTYSGAKIRSLTLTDTHVHYVLEGKTGRGDKRGRYRLEVDAERANGAMLKAPYDGNMRERVAEALTANAHVRLYNQDGRVIFDEVGHCAGLEVVGDLSRVTT